MYMPYMSSTLQHLDPHGRLRTRLLKAMLDAVLFEPGLFEDEAGFVVCGC